MPAGDGGDSPALGEQQSHHEVHRVQMRVPPFWPDDPEMWFAQLESQFLLNGITADATKYGYVAGHLEARYASEVRDILTQPPTTGKYDKIRAELIKRLSISQERKTKQLLEREELGDRQPTQFLRHLQNLAGTTVPDALLRSIWASRLPPNVQAILATQAKASNGEAAELADAILATTTSQVYEARASDQILQTLINEVSQLKTQLRGRTEKSSGDRSRRQRSRSRNTQEFDTCWYHFKFGQKARNCKAPCKFTPKAENSVGGR